MVEVAVYVDRCHCLVVSPQGVFWTRELYIFKLTKRRANNYINNVNIFELIFKHPTARIVSQLGGKADEKMLSTVS